MNVALSSVLTDAVDMDSIIPTNPALAITSRNTLKVERAVIKRCPNDQTQQTPEHVSGVFR
jgi:hypothetical protein